MSRRTQILGTAGAVYFIALILIGMWPTPVDRSFSSTIFDVTQWSWGHGAPHWFSYGFIESSANVALFVPLGLLGDAWFHHRAPVRVVALSALVSVTIELVQWAARSERFATPEDVIANTIGAALGVGIAQVLRR